MKQRGGKEKRKGKEQERRCKETAAKVGAEVVAVVKRAAAERVVVALRSFWWKATT